MPTNEHHHPALLLLTTQTKPTTTTTTTPTLTPTSKPKTATQHHHHVRRPNWTTAEDEQLCRSWLENALDPLTNTPQKGSQFWNKVAAHFAAHHTGPIARNQDHVRNRWQLLHSKVLKFSGYYERVKKAQMANTRSTGAGIEEEEELVREAMRVYEREEQHKFTYHSSWHLLRRSSRWQRFTYGGTGGVPHGVGRQSQGSIDGPTTAEVGSAEGLLLDRVQDRMMAGRRRRQIKPEEQEHDAHPEELDRLLASALKRKAEVDQESLELQLLKIDPLTLDNDPLRREVYTLKMQDLRDRYREKRLRTASVLRPSELPRHPSSSSASDSELVDQLDLSPPCGSITPLHDHQHQQQQQQQLHNLHPQLNPFTDPTLTTQDTPSTSTTNTNTNTTNSSSTSESS
ncbi:uncharacterized protein PGTG_19137 [Puccinia graminis f. sp. tritici CRL 75-36-700-3]|uniref:Myb-like domain-containing protein n=1 Tax=Puccinia graminis f. sp. tritici (strain CRL 75-36-700-3 / race SCCL) TaxID=418459 RepID=E3L9F2_PUCGT|nr:uncharacterized protein PGTG_19137 [Puccinia graminis f. sp. tritici CRL 75-36-700-3]EFP93177.2 hypothetical protein PGTG_19137 [Puccinia graminis f. sp. tritici CRL 75-36-700-3]